ncbi:MAG: sel1 repeat family protein [Thiovulaceae bacterium]|nr:sel1 repeat family protein [Sulfurimonadaceae bacterium]
MKFVLLLFMGLSLFGNEFASMKSSFEEGDLNRAITYARMPAMNGNVSAMYDLGLLYYATGSLKEARRWLERSVENGGKGELTVSIILFSQSRNRDGYNRVVQSLINVPKSPLRDALMAVSKDLSSNRHEAPAESYLRLGELFYSDKIIHPDLRIALFLTNQAANKGNVKAIELMGDAYWRSSYTDRSLMVAPQTGNGLTIALEYYTKASSLGNLDAMAKAGKLHIIGPRNLRRINYGMELITQAANAGGALGAFMLGEIYMNGQGVERNRALAQQWLLKATDVCEANRLLANLYDTGETASAYAQAYKVCSTSRSMGKAYAVLFEPF